MIVLHGVLLDVIHLHELQGRGVPVVARGFAPQAIDRAVTRGGDDPAGRRRRQAFERPALQCRREGVLHGFFRQRDVAQRAHEHRHGTAVLAAEYLLDLVLQCGSMKGRTSMGTPIARASLRPQSSAASRSGARTMLMPPICSLLSMK